MTTIQTALYESARAVVDSAVFGAIAYGVAEAVRYGTSAFLASEWSLLVSNTTALSTLSTVNPLYFGGVGALFIVIDGLSKLIFKVIFQEYSDSTALVLSRLTLTVVASAGLAAVTGLVPSFAIGCGLLSLSIATYTVAQAIFGAFDRGRYGMPGHNRLLGQT